MALDGENARQLHQQRVPGRRQTMTDHFQALLSDLVPALGETAPVLPQLQQLEMRVAHGGRVALDRFSERDRQVDNSITAMRSSNA
jgi:hypothetical protein